MTPPVEQRVSDLRLDRRALRAEHARVAWWRRLVRARLDLAVAQAARPQTLGEDVAFQLPLEVGLDVPRPAALAAVLAGADGVGADVGRPARAARPGRAALGLRRGRRGRPAPAPPTASSSGSPWTPAWSSRVCASLWAADDAHHGAD